MAHPEPLPGASDAYARHGPFLSADSKRALLVCHMAVLSGEHPPNSLDAIQECVDVGVARLEIDIHSLTGDDYAVFHDRRLERETTGSGAIGSCTPEGIRSARFKAHPETRPALLSEVIEMARGGSIELQLDWKDWRLVSPERLQALVRLVRPLHEQVIVSTGQDWNLRRLHEADSGLAYGFDPGLYLDHAIEQQPAPPLPRNIGGYGYRDDHPMAFGRIERPADYLAARMEALTRQAPGAREYFLNYRLVLQMLDDGFNPAEWLHEHGIDANVWTPDYHGPESVRAIERLIGAGVDRITTNTAHQWMRAMETAESLSE